MTRELGWVIALTASVGVGYIPSVQQYAQSIAIFGMPGLLVLIGLQTTIVLALLFAGAVGWLLEDKWT